MLHKKGIYGLKQVSLLANDKLVKYLKKCCHSVDTITPSLWTHNVRKTEFGLCVDDFGVKYYIQEDAQHLVNSLKDTYEFKADYSGKNYYGLTLDW